MLRWATLQSGAGDQTAAFLFFVGAQAGVFVVA
jgi:hypothetical protein